MKVADVASAGCPLPRKKSTFVTVMIRECLVSQQGPTLFPWISGERINLGLATVMGTILMYLSGFSDGGEVQSDRSLL